MVKYIARHFVWFQDQDDYGYTNINYLHLHMGLWVYHDQCAMELLT
jgi:hypothetical protein